MVRPMARTRRLFLPALILLCALSGGAQSITGSQEVPIRSLQAEMARAEQGSAAYIHTQFATGTGLVLRGEVVTARHNVLTPGGEIAAEIGVGVPEPPLNNIIETLSVAIAQDPVHDLVLLRITGEATLPAAARPEAAESARSELPAIAPCQPIPLPAEVSQTRAVRVRHAGRKRSMAAVHLRSASLSRPQTSARPHAQLHIVWDGPLARSR